MTDLYEAMSSLRAVRRLKPDPIPAEVMQRILQAAAWAPSGGNVQPFRILNVTDSDKKAAIAELVPRRMGEIYEEYAFRGTRKPNGKMLRAGDYLANHMGEAPAVIVFCFNPKHMAITDAGMDRESVVGGGSVYPAVQNLMLACRAEGIGCVLTTLLCFKEAEIKLLLDIPEGWGTCAHIPIGYPVLKGHGPTSRRPIEKLVYTDTWGNSYG